MLSMCMILSFTWVYLQTWFFSAGHDPVFETSVRYPFFRKGGEHNTNSKIHNYYSYTITNCNKG